MQVRKTAELRGFQGLFGISWDGIGGGDGVPPSAILPDFIGNHPLVIADKNNKASLAVMTRGNEIGSAQAI